MNALSFVLSIDTSSSQTRLGLAVLIGAAVLALALALMMLRSDQRSDLEKRLTGFAFQEPEPEPDPTPKPEHGAETRFVRDIANLTGRLADRVGLLNRVEHKLEQADLPLRPPEAIFFYFMALFVVLVGGVLMFALPAALILTALATLLPMAWLELRRKRRLRRFEVQLPDVLNMLSGTMRAGFSFAQGLEAVADEASDPARRELQRAFAESRLGRPIEDALEESATRMQSVDLSWAVLAIRIQREVGGNLAELLDTVARTMTERERLRHEIMSLTAEGRLSAWVLGFFPPAFAGVLYIVQPTYMSVLFNDAIGIMAVGISVVMMFLGFVWLRKIMAIEV
jgi:tight adherence protein B